MQNLKYTDKFIENPTPVEIRPNCYAGKAKAKSGEDIYLWMELITEQNEIYWMQYTKQTGLIAPGRNRGILSALIAKTVTHRDESTGVVHFSNPNYQACQERSGFNEQEFKEYITYLGKQGLLNTKKSKVLAANAAGSSHITLVANDSRYVIYATKTPDFAINTIPLLPKNQETLTLKEFNEWYQDLLICVGCHFTSPKIIHNRGIFRNPSSVVDDTHKGISMLLHAFSGAVAIQFFKEKEFLQVRPVSSMQYIICCSLNPEDVNIANSSLAVERDRAKVLLDEEGEEHPWNNIKISALARYYIANGNQASPQYSTKGKDEHIVDSALNFFKNQTPTSSSGACNSLGCC